VDSNQSISSNPGRPWDKEQSVPGRKKQSVPGRPWDKEQSVPGRKKQSVPGRPWDKEQSVPGTGRSWPLAQETISYIMDLTQILIPDTEPILQVVE